MMPCIEKIQVFVEMNYYKPYQTLRHHNLNHSHMEMDSLETRTVLIEIFMLR